jgi:uncharacterized membrane protein YkoI
MRPDRFIRNIFLAAVIGVALPAQAGVIEDALGGDEAHGFVSIDTVIDAARDAVPGMVVEAELEKEHGRWIYEVEIITPNHQKVELSYDARTGALVTMRKKR